MTTAAAEKSELLIDPAFMARLDQLDVLSRKLLAGKLKGERRSKRRGQSVEFADYRNYTVGDDLRFIDWNIYARLDRLFLKLFLEEEDLSLYILIDTSLSVNYGNPDKAIYLKRVAAALGYIGLVNYNRVHLCAIADGIAAETGALRGRRRVGQMIDFVGKLKPAGPSHFGDACKKFAMTHRQKGVCVVLSDFFVKEGFETGLRYIAGGKYDLFCVQVLSPQEIDPDLAGDLKLRDVEDGDMAEVSITQPLLARYKRNLNAYCLSLKDYLTRRGGTYLFTSTAVPFDTLVLNYLRERGLLGQDAMGWFPKFLNLWPAGLAAAIAIPSLVALYFLKLRRRELPVSSTFLWRKAVQELQVNAPFQRLRKNLLLLLQLLLLAALILALARPVLHYTPGAGPRSIILIDRSAPMSAVDSPDGKTRLDLAKQRARDLVDTLDRKGVAMVIAFDDSAQIVQPFTADQRTLKDAIDSIEPTDRLTYFQSAYRLADAQAAAAQETNNVSVQVRSRPDVYIYTTGRAQDADKAVLQGNLHYEKIGSDAAPNIAIVAMSARRDYTEPTHVEVFVRLANYGPDPVNGVPVQLSVDGHVMRSASVNLLPDRYTQDQRDTAVAGGFDFRDSVVFPTLDLTDSAVIMVEQLQRQGDALGSDDSAQVVVPPPKILSVLLVSDGNIFLDHVLQAQKLKVLDRMSIGEYVQQPSADGGGKKLAKPYDVIIFDRCNVLRAQDVPRTGAAIYFGCVPPGLELKPQLDADGHPVFVDDNPVLDWKRDHPILRHLNFAKLYVARTQRLLPTLNSEVLIQGEAAPLMVLHRQDRAFHLVIPFDLWQSGWPLNRTFPVFFFQALQYLALGTDLELKPSYQPGAALRIPRFDLDKAASPSPAEITLNGPMGTQRIEVPPAGDFVLPQLDKVGLYTTDPPIPQYEKIAVNLLDPTESNIQPVEQVPGVPGQTVASTPVQSRLELWWWLVAAALPLLLVEWWVYTRRVHL